MKKFIEKHPIIASILIFFLFWAAQELTGLVIFFMPDNIFMSFFSQVVFILLPLAFVLMFGWGKIYKNGGFWKTLGAGGYMLVTQLFALVLVILLNVLMEEKLAGPVYWIYGILSLFGIGFREESIFRGLIVNIIAKKYIKDRKGIFITSWVSALIFGFMHMTNMFAGVDLQSAFIQSVVATGIGFYLAAIYLRGGSIWAVIFLHSLTDAASLFNAYFIVSEETVEGIIDQISILNIMPFFTFTLLGLFLLRKKKCIAVLERFNPRDEEIIEAEV